MGRGRADPLVFIVGAFGHPGIRVGYGSGLHRECRGSRLHAEGSTHRHTAARRFAVRSHTRVAREEQALPEGFTNLPGDLEILPGGDDEGADMAAVRRDVEVARRGDVANWVDGKPEKPESVDCC